MAVRPVGTPLGSLLGPGYRRAPRAVKSGRPAPDEDAPWPWSPPASHGPARRLWAGCRLVALAVALAAVLVIGLVAAGAGLWWWLGHLASSSHH